MSDKKDSKNTAWEKTRDAANAATTANSKALQDDALTDVEPGVKLKTDLKGPTEEE